MARPPSGFTLVEILLAILVLSIALLPLAHLQMGTSRQVRFNRERAFASCLAANAVEIHRSLDLAALTRGRENLGAGLAPGSGQADPVFCPWTDERVRAGAQKSPALAAALEAYRREMEAYRVQADFRPGADAAGRMGTVSARVRRAGSESRETLAAAAFIVVDPAFPTGKPGTAGAEGGGE